MYQIEFGYLQKIEYEIETKETMQREQKVIVLRTITYCSLLCEDCSLSDLVYSFGGIFQRVLLQRLF